MIDALKRASAGSIIAVHPLLRLRAPGPQGQAAHAHLGAKLVADLLTAAGVDRVLSIDLHAGQIQGFFNIPVDHLYAHAGADRRAARPLRRSESVIVSPDAGGVERARAYSKRLGASLAIIDKRRPRPTSAEVMNIIGDVEGQRRHHRRRHGRHRRHALRGGPGGHGAGARAVYACASHGVLSRPGDRAHHGLAARRAHHHRHHPAARRGPRPARRSRFSASPACSARRSSASTTATRSARCSSERSRTHHAATSKEERHGFRKGHRRGQDRHRQGRRPQGSRRGQGPGRPLRARRSEPDRR